MVLSHPELFSGPRNPSAEKLRPFVFLRCTSCLVGKPSPLPEYHRVRYIVYKGKTRGIRGLIEPDFRISAYRMEAASTRYFQSHQQDGAKGGRHLH
jgi:hypothetical protein